MVARDTSGNMIRPPYRSVSAPTGIRPTEPTITGTATTSDCWNGDRCSTSLNFGPSGDSSAHAQKFTAKPTVAITSITHGWVPDAGDGRRAACVTSVFVSTWLLIDTSITLLTLTCFFTMPFG